MTDPTRSLDDDDGSFDLIRLRAERLDAAACRGRRQRGVLGPTSGGAVGAAVSAKGATVGAGSHLPRASPAGVARWFGIGLASGLVITEELMRGRGGEESGGAMTNTSVPVMAPPASGESEVVPRFPIRAPHSAPLPAVAPPADEGVPGSPRASLPAELALLESARGVFFCIILSPCSESSTPMIV